MRYYHISYLGIKDQRTFHVGQMVLKDAEATPLPHPPVAEALSIIKQRLGLTFVMPLYCQETGEADIKVLNELPAFMEIILP